MTVDLLLGPEVEADAIDLVLDLERRGFSLRLDYCGEPTVEPRNKLAWRDVDRLRRHRPRRDRDRHVLRHAIVEAVGLMADIRVPDLKHADADDLGAAHATSGQGVTLSDFRAYMPSHSYIFIPSREMWPASSVNARLAPMPLVNSHGRPVLDKHGEQKHIPASAWLDEHRPVEQMTWVPGMPMLVTDRLVADGGWIAREGCTTFIRYRAPTIGLGDARLAGEWVAHVKKVYPQDADHIAAWLAHRRQRPEEKINHALVLGGLQGIGKDTLLDPVKHAVGPWNFVEVSPAHMLGRFNGFTKSVILRVSEIRDLGEVDRFSFYDHLKIYTAAPPDVLRVDEKHLRGYAVFNACGVVITTNHRTDGLLPADDRRHYVAWSERTKDDFTADYWTRLYGWYAREGRRHVAAYLDAHDLSAFDPKAPPPKTAAFWDVVDAGRAPEDAELADALETLGHPTAVTLAAITGLVPPPPIADWLRDRKNSRQIPHRLEAAGYVAVRNAAAKDGYWAIDGRRQVVYARHDLSLRDRIRAAQEVARGR